MLNKIKKEEEKKEKDLEEMKKIILAFREETEGKCEKEVKEMRKEIKELEELLMSNK